MKRIIQYQLVYHKKVNAFIKDGWQPFGSPFATSGEGAQQAIVRYEEDPHVHVSDGDTYLSSPNNLKCKICGEFYIDE